MNTLRKGALKAFPTRLAIFLSVLIACLISSTVTLAQSSITRTPWQINRGAGVQCAKGLLDYHGDIRAYKLAFIPQIESSGWNYAHNKETVDFIEDSRIPSSIECNGEALNSCLNAVDFTYFQTIVNIPLEYDVRTFMVSFDGIDDGARVTIFNSAHPAGVVVPGSYVFLSGSGTANLQSLLMKGELNRVVITQMDDCPVGNTLAIAKVIINGFEVLPNRPPQIALTSPANQESFPQDVSVNIVAQASDADDGVARVQFLADGELLASGHFQKPKYQHHQVVKC